MMILSILALILSPQGYRGELRERLDAPVKATIDTPKRSYDLEICIADALTVLGAPTVFRDGPDNVVIAAAFPGGNTYLASVSILKTASGSRLELRLRGKGWDDRIKKRLTACA